MTAGVEQKTGLIQKIKRPKIIILLLVLVFVIAGAVYAAMEKASDDPAFCANCHNMQSHYDTYTTGNLLAKKHADAKVNCHACHEPSITQQVEEGIKYITGDFEEPLAKRQFSKDMCLKCHNYEDVKSKTATFEQANPHDSHNGEQECYKCHSVHQESTVQCTQCHKFPWMNKLDQSWRKGVK